MTQRIAVFPADRHSLYKEHGYSAAIRSGDLLFVSGQQAGERAPDAPLLGAGGQSLRLFQLLQGPDWNLLAYETHGKVIDARRNLRIHHIGEQDELIDTLGHFRESYQLAPGQCVLIRPDGYVGAFFHGKQSNDIENYLSRFAIGIKDEY